MVRSSCPTCRPMSASEPTPPSTRWWPADVSNQRRIVLPIRPRCGGAAGRRCSRGVRRPARSRLARRCLRRCRVVRRGRRRSYDDHRRGVRLGMRRRGDQPGRSSCRDRLLAGRAMDPASAPISSSPTRRVPDSAGRRSPFYAPRRHGAILVSCDPVSLARDAGLLRESGYDHTRSTVYDLFPQTHHVEVVTTFDRRRAEATTTVGASDARPDRERPGDPPSSSDRCRTSPATWCGPIGGTALELPGRSHDVRPRPRSC